MNNIDAGSGEKTGQTIEYPFDLRQTLLQVKANAF